MKLICDLPEMLRDRVEPYLHREQILYCVPSDVSLHGKYMEGFAIVTASRLIVTSDCEVVREISISEGSHYRAVAHIGGGELEAEIAGRPTILARYSMTYVPLYAEIARVLSQIHSGQTAKPKDTGEERVCPKCGRTYPEGSSVCPACLDKLAVLKRLVQVARPHWRLLGVAMLLFWTISGLQLLVPALYRLLIDNYLRTQKQSPGMYLLLVCAIGAVNLANALIGIARARTMVLAGGRLAKDIRALVYGKLQALSLSYLDRQKTGDLMNRVTSDTQRVQQFIERQSTTAVNEILLMLGVSVILFASNWRLALLVVAPAPLVLVIVGLIRERIRLMYRRQWRLFDKANSLLQDILSGIRVVKAFGQEGREVCRFQGASRELSETVARNEKTWNTLFPAIGFFLGIGRFLVLYYGGRLVLGEELELGQLFQFSQYAGMLYGPLQWVSFIPRWFAEAMTSAERVFEIIDEEPDVKDRERPIRHRIEGAVTFEGVTFGYRSHEPVLEDISLDVTPGEMIGLVGHSGAGKSTLINLVMRLYDVDEGRILIDGIDIRDISQQDLRSQVGVVLQETFLFQGTILENIRYARPDASLDDVIRAARIANAHDFIVRFPDGYDTLVGERGQRLSGGERQRIAIARALLHDPRILILDEATSSVDTETEQQIQEALARLVKNRTTFAIAHRLSTLRNADRIMVIDKGRRAELGTHEELLKAKGIYYNLVMQQRKMSRVQAVEG